MIIGFKTKFPKELGKKPTEFVKKIQDGIKITTFREDRLKRWKAGRVIQFYEGGYRQGHRKKFHEDTCKSVQEVVLKNDFRSGAILRSLDGGRFKPLDYEQLFDMARNDGFDSASEFITYFIPKSGSEWEGRIIHWTDLKYA